MRSAGSMVSLLLAALIAIGTSYYFLKRSVPESGTVATQAISTTGVQMDLVAIAQAERLYLAQNGSYGTMDQLTSNGVMNLSRTERDGYTYSVTTSEDGFVVTATHADVPPPPGTQPLHYPTMSIDQSMQVKQGE